MCLEASRGTSIEVEPPNPEDMDGLRFSVISTIEVIACQVSDNVENTENVGIEVQVYCIIRCEHHDVGMRAGVD